jgi:prevent-host-death family protein
MKVMKASEFKATCLKVMDEVESSGEPVLITKNGRPVSKLVPVRELPQTLFGVMKGRVKIKGDIISPVDTDWESAR